jgi:hypothetical protein
VFGLAGPFARASAPFFDFSQVVRGEIRILIEMNLSEIVKIFQICSSLQVALVKGENETESIPALYHRQSNTRLKNVCLWASPD